MIERNPEKIANEHFSLVIAGGGIYGAMLFFLAASNGIKTLLLEQSDFGSGTSYNSLRTIHGGLRNLQNLNFRQFHRFSGERKWFLSNFPGLVKPIPVLMPLYNRKLHRKILFKGAFLAERLLGFSRNRVMQPEQQLSFGRIADKKEVIEIFPLVDDNGLKGGAVWYDATMPDSQRIIIDLIRSGCDAGGTALNYMQARDLQHQKNIVAGISAMDQIFNKEYSFATNAVVNCAGPDSVKLAKKWHGDFPHLFRKSLAWNILFDREAISGHALAVTPNKRNTQTYFLHPWKGKLLAGTGHAVLDESDTRKLPTDEEILQMITDLNRAIPNLKLKKEEVLHVFSGLLPVKKDKTTLLAKQAVIIDHADFNGPRGFYSLSGVKFTSAHSVATGILKMIFPKMELAGKNAPQITEYQVPGIEKYAGGNSLSEPARRKLMQLYKQESCMYLSDLLIRRTTIGDNPREAVRIAKELCEYLDFDKEQSARQMAEIRSYFPFLNQKIDQ